MGQYTVKHQRDRTCSDCKYYSPDIFEDSFGEWTDENCDKGALRTRRILRRSMQRF